MATNSAVPNITEPSTPLGRKSGVRRPMAPPTEEGEEECNNVQVCVRIRPNSAKEKESNAPNCIVAISETELKLRKKGANGVPLPDKQYTFDNVFTSHSTQEEVFRCAIDPLVEEVLNGFNCTVFAYGQTGTGKTHTMEGVISSNVAEKDAGVIPRTVNTIFQRLQNDFTEFSVKVSFLELYNEELSDLLTDDVDRQLRIYEDTTGRAGMMVNGLEEIIVTGPEQVFDLLRQSQMKRRVAETNMNAKSSRSHYVFSITIHTRDPGIDGDDVIKTGKLHLVDLAGSECVGKSGAQNQRAKEAGKINQSLLTLGRVINALVEKQPYIPYRDSKLTRLLQESLGGRSKTCIIATVSPSSLWAEESISTLEYANRAKNIKNKPQVNQKLSKKSYMKDLVSQIARLKEENMALRMKNGIFLPPDQYEELTEGYRSKCDQLQEAEFTLVSKEKELEEVRELCNMSKAELEALTEKFNDCEMKLEVTKEVLTETKVTLTQTYEQLDETRFLVRQQARSEGMLASEAFTLKSVLDEVLDDKNKLHAKVERKHQTEVSNLAAVSDFETQAQRTLSQFRDNTMTGSADLRAFGEQQKRDLNIFVLEHNEATAVTTDIVVRATQKSQEQAQTLQTAIERDMTTSTQRSEVFAAAAAATASEATQQTQQQHADVVRSVSELMDVVSGLDSVEDKCTVASAAAGEASVAAGMQWAAADSLAQQFSARATEAATAHREAVARADAAYEEKDAAERSKYITTVDAVHGAVSVCVDTHAQACTAHEDAAAAFSRDAAAFDEQQVQEETRYNQDFHAIEGTHRATADDERDSISAALTAADQMDSVDVDAAVAAIAVASTAAASAHAETTAFTLSMDSALETHGTRTSADLSSLGSAQELMHRSHNERVQALSAELSAFQTQMERQLAAESEALLQSISNLVRGFVDTQTKAVQTAVASMHARVDAHTSAFTADVTDAQQQVRSVRVAGEEFVSAQRGAVEAFANDAKAVERKRIVATEALTSQLQAHRSRLADAIAALQAKNRDFNAAVHARYDELADSVDTHTTASTALLTRTRERFAAHDADTTQRLKNARALLQALHSDHTARTDVLRSDLVAADAAKRAIVASVRDAVYQHVDASTIARQQYVAYVSTSATENTTAMRAATEDIQSTLASATADSTALRTAHTGASNALTASHAAQTSALLSTIAAGASLASQHAADSAAAARDTTAASAEALQAMDAHAAALAAEHAKRVQQVSVLATDAANALVAQSSVALAQAAQLHVASVRTIDDLSAMAHKLATQDTKPDVPTGQTPIKREFTFPNRFTRTRDADAIVNDFRVLRASKLAPVAMEALHEDVEAEASSNPASPVNADSVEADNATVTESVGEAAEETPVEASADTGADVLSSVTYEMGLVDVDEVRGQILAEPSGELWTPAAHNLDLTGAPAASVAQVTDKPSMVEEEDPDVSFAEMQTFSPARAAAVDKFKRRSLEAGLEDLLTPTIIEEVDAMLDMPLDAAVDADAIEMSSSVAEPAEPVVAKPTLQVSIPSGSAFTEAFTPSSTTSSLPPLPSLSRRNVENDENAPVAAPVTITSTSKTAVRPNSVRATRVAMGGTGTSTLRKPASTPAEDDKVVRRPTVTRTMRPTANK